MDGIDFFSDRSNVFVYIMGVHCSEMKIALDFDNVLAHTTQFWVEICNHRNNGAMMMTTRDVETWDFWKTMGLDKEEAFQIFDICWSGWDKIPSLEHETHQKVKMIKNLSDRTDIVTSVKEQHKNDIFSWLKKFKIPYDRLVFSTNKFDLDYDIFIDDSPDNALEIAKNNKICLLYNQPWNRKVQESNNIRRVYNLYHAIDIIRDLNASR